MKKAYGNFHYCANFFDRVISKSPRSLNEAIEAFHIASKLLKAFDELQQTNPLVTLSFATDSLRVYFRGQLQFHIQARKCRTIIWIPYAYSRHLAKQIQKRSELFPDEMATISWVITQQGVNWLLDYLWAYWKTPDNDEPNKPIKHSRHIPGDVRQAVLSEFLESGRWCPGVEGMTKRHRVSDTMRIEFDHILPHSTGGSNSYWNVQVLCSECNKIKRATAA